MKKRSLTIVILVIVALIISVITVDLLRNRPGERGTNPYALEVDQFREVDQDLLSHHESRKLGLGDLKATAMVASGGTLYLCGDSTLVNITTDGKVLKRFPILPGASSLWVSDGKAWVGHGSYISVYDLEKESMAGRWDGLDERTVITGMAGKGERLYVADAGNRRVLMYGPGGELLGSFEGKAETEAGHGFIVPSANFDLMINDYGELWVVNPGKHALENYSDDGRMRGFWENTSFDIDGFLGCCNPARICGMSDGRILTSEKGMVRIKIYGPSGDLKSVVAGPSLFSEEGKAPDVAAIGETVFALEYENNVIRIFEHLANE